MKEELGEERREGMIEEGVERGRSCWACIVGGREGGDGMMGEGDEERGKEGVGETRGESN